MRRMLPLVVTLAALLAPLQLSAQIKDATVCDILANPQSFDGKTVRIKGLVVAGFEEFEVRGTGCNQAVKAIWLSYPEGTNGKAGPVALLRLQLAKNSGVAVDSVSRVPVTLDKNKDFETFDKLLSTPAKASGTCLGCVKYAVTATIVGRLDGTQTAGLVRESGGKVTGLSGFGNLNRYKARLVVQSVADIFPQEIDYSKANAAAASEAPGLNPGPPTADQLKRSVDAFGGPGEDNGVNVGVGEGDEVPKDDSLNSGADSPDGFIFDVVFDSERLKKQEMSIALVHSGAHIAEIRDPAMGSSNLDAYGEEFRAWQITVLSAVGNNTKALVLPGGYLIYSRSWPNSELGQEANAGIAGYVTNEAGITHQASH